MAVRSMLVVLLACSAALSAATRQSAIDRTLRDQPSVVEQQRVSVTLEDDSSLLYHVTTRVRVQNEAGVRERGTVIVPYARDLSTLDIEYVRVRKASGDIIDTPVGTALDLPLAITREAPVYSDGYERHVNVQGLAAGDVVEYAYRLRERPSFPGHAAFELEFLPNEISLNSEAQLSIPADRHVNVKTSGAPPAITSEGDRRIYRWTYSNLDPTSEERIYAFLRERLTRRPSVQVSTFRSWDELGAAVKALWRDRAEVTPEIRQKAAELTKGLTTDGQKMQALLSFVSTKVRYLGVSFGIGRLQPNSASDVLRNGYGDCKDKHVLLEALLRSVGITASPVLVGLGDVVDADVPSVEQFDHVVTLATETSGGTVWLDATIDMAPAGHLSAFARNRQGLLVAVAGPGRLIPTPRESVQPNTWSLHLDGKVDDHGVLHGSIKQAVTGDSAVLLRSMFRDDPALRRASDGETQLEPVPLAGERSAVSVTAVDDPTQPLVFTFSFVSKAFVDWSTNELQSFVPSSMIGEAPVDLKVPFPLKFAATTEQTFSFRIQLPSGFDAAFPKNRTTYESVAAPDFGSHRLRLRAENGVVDGERDVRIDVIELPAERTADYRAFHDAATEAAPVITVRERWPWTSVSRPRIEWPSGGSPEADALVSKSMTASPEQAVDLLRQAVAIDPKHPSAWGRLGLRQAQLGSTPDAIQSHYRQIEEAPSPAAYKTLAQALPFLRRDETGRIYREAARAFPDDRDFPALLAEYLVRSHQAAEAVSVLETEIARRPRSSRLHAYMGRAAVLANQPDKPSRPSRAPWNSSQVPTFARRPPSDWPKPTGNSTARSGMRSWPSSRRSTRTPRRAFRRRLCQAPSLTRPRAWPTTGTRSAGFISGRGI
jgi:transglutaminase-like putative cysteine protease